MQRTMDGPSQPGHPWACSFVMVVAPLSFLAIVTAGVLDPRHDLWADYVSWLSDGPYWLPAGLGVAGLGLSASIDARHIRHTLASGRSRLAAVAFLACTAVLAAGTLALPSKGFDEPLWRTATHVGLAVGAYAGVLGAATLVALQQRIHGVAGPRMTRWAVAVLAGLLALGAASAQARLASSGPDLRGLAQMAAFALTTGWLTAASRLKPAPQP